jgi:signal peptidase I
MPPTRARGLVPLIALLAMVLLVIRGVRPYAIDGVAKAFRIPGPSMQPTLLPGDFVLTAFRTPYRPTRGSLVVFVSVQDPALRMLSRVVAVPGDTVAMENGALTLNRVSLPEPYVQEPPDPTPDPPALAMEIARWQGPFLARPAKGYSPDRHNWGPLIVPPENYMVLGDNRDHTNDSRYWGWLPSDHILGAPRYIYYSYDPGSYRLVPQVTAVRWNRIGTHVH